MVEKSSLKSPDPFEEIRPYSNREAPEVLNRLSRDPEFASIVAAWRFSVLSRYWSGLAKLLTKFWLWWNLRRLSSVEDLQNLIAPKLARMIEKTSKFSVSGLQKFDLRHVRLYLSNHRDIVMDPAYANYALHRAGSRTLAIAIGDNLLSKPWVADLMRLNKSFVVKRKVSGPRALLYSSKLLARFIRQSVGQNIDPIWIAHRDGRAKDGKDQTDPAVIKMLVMARDRNETPEEVLNCLNIVPLVISYELDPCDYLKAAELAAGEGYTKTESEDVASIAIGITGQKGCVHLHFGDLLSEDLNVEGVVRAIDEQMRTYYRLFRTNVWAWEWLNQRKIPTDIEYHTGSVSESVFRARIDAAPTGHRDWMLRMYANPVNQILEPTRITEDF